MHTTIGQQRGQHPSITPWRRRGCTLAVLGGLAGCGGGDASSLIGAAVVTSGTTQAVPAEATGQAVAPAAAPATAAANVAQTVVASGPASDTATAGPNRR